VLVNLVTSVIGRRRGFALEALAGTGDGPALICTREIYADGRWQTAAVYARDRLRPGDRIEGPAVVQQVDATTVIEPGAVAVVDKIGNLRIAVGTGSDPAGLTPWHNLTLENGVRPRGSDPIEPP
jgi:N-methylhydantoinase A